MRIVALIALLLLLAPHYVRLRRALHLFQLEGYKRGRFLRWCAAHPGPALFLTPRPQKKPLVMTERARRLLALATAMPVVVLLLALLPADRHLTFTKSVWVLVGVFVLLGMPLILVAADFLLAPVQRSVNEGFRRAARAKLDEVAPLVIGVTGSFGKTSTKFAIQHLLDGDQGIALATPGSFNNPLGVSRTINERLGPQHRYFVVEMGAYGEGEIAELCRFVGPRIGVLTAIGPAHLERFGSMDAIRRAKYEIVTSLPTDGTALFNVDDPETRKLADATDRVATVRYGIDPAGEPHVTATDVEVAVSGASFVIADRRDGTSLAVHTKLLGRHAIGHVLAGVAVARLAGRALAELAAPIASLSPVEHRLQLLEGNGGVTVIDDAYNSNPEGAEAALEVLAAMPARKRVVVTPGMIELGERQFEANLALGRRAASVADVVVVVAQANREAITSGAREGRADVVTVDTLAQATERLRSILLDGDAVLFENDLPDHYEI